MSRPSTLKPLDFIGSSREDLKEFPDEVKQDIGYALFEALKGFGGAGVLEIIERFDGDTSRAVYTVKFREVVYVLHGFQKKSKSGIKTPQQDIELIQRRLKAAEEDYKAHYLGE